MRNLDSKFIRVTGPIRRFTCRVIGHRWRPKMRGWWCGRCERFEAR